MAGVEKASTSPRLPAVPVAQARPLRLVACASRDPPGTVAWLLSLHPAAAGRVYAAYDGDYIGVAISCSFGRWTEFGSGPFLIPSRSPIHQFPATWITKRQFPRERCAMARRSVTAPWANEVEQ